MNPLAAQGGGGNATEAKIDFSVAKDATGKVQIRWIPKINYAQPSPANAMLGGNWNGMPVVAYPRAADFLGRMLFPALHPQARRADIAAATLRDISRVDAEIAKNRSQTMAAIQQDQYLTLTSQELYVNPRTKEVELGSNEWKHRWVGPAGEVIYTDDGSWNPNLDPSLKRSGFERSPVKKR